MSYFSENYEHVSFPIQADDEPGLRNAQLGATHAVASYFTIRKDPAIVVMPTGSGKTGVLMLCPFLLLSNRHPPSRAHIGE